MQYDAKFKRKVILIAKKCGNRNAERQFLVSEDNVRRWRNQRVSIFKYSSTLKSFRKPKDGRYQEIEKVVANFVRKSMANGLPITRRMMYYKAKQGSTTRGIKSFKMSEGWCHRFM